LWPWTRLALLSLGVAAAVRNSAAAIGLVLALLLGALVLKSRPRFTKQRKDKAMTDAAQRASATAAYTGSGAISIIRAFRWRGRPPATRIVAISAVLTVMAFAVVACSSPSPGSTPEAGSSPVTTAQLVEFAQCMRSHDIKNFPDPVNGAFNFSGVGADSVDPNSPAFQSAKAACIHLVPGEAQRLAVTAQELAAGDKLATCMRSHGFPAFPDPTSQNVFDVPKSINIALPGYQSAFSTCQSQAHDDSGVFPGAASNGQGS
jgi:hypothetical protein